jgi:dUTP pyrophosphatase
MDLYAAISDDVLLEPGVIVSIPCGIAIALPQGFEAQIRPRSGLSGSYGIAIPNSPGTVDPDYRGELKILLMNQGSEPFRITRGMRIAQMVVSPVVRVVWEEVEDLPPTRRGVRGFGHTGR